VADHIDIVSSFIRRGRAVDVRGAIEALGITYREIDLPDGNSGRIDRDGDRFTISVNRNEGAARRRFTAAHELAHFLLHRDLLKHGHADRLFDPDASTNPSAPFTRTHEFQANQMAANILMPRSRLENRVREGLTLPQLAAEFDVSPAAMRVRLGTLGLSVNE